MIGRQAARARTPCCYFATLRLAGRRDAIPFLAQARIVISWLCLSIVLVRVFSLRPSPNLIEAREAHVISQVWAVDR